MLSRTVFIHAIRGRPLWSLLIIIIWWRCSWNLGVGTLSIPDRERNTWRRKVRKVNVASKMASKWCVCVCVCFVLFSAEIVTANYMFIWCVRRCWFARISFTTSSLCKSTNISSEVLPVIILLMYTITKEIMILPQFYACWQDCRIRRLDEKQFIRFLW